MRPLDDVRRRIKQAMRSGDPREIPFLLDCISETDRDGGISVPLVAAHALGMMGLPAAAGALDSLAHHADPHRRAFGARALGETRDEKALPWLSVLADDVNDEVVLQASGALAKVGDAAVPCLRDLLLRSKGRLPRAAYYVDALHKIGSPPAREAMVEGTGTLSVDRRTTLLTFMSPDDI